MVCGPLHLMYRPDTNVVRFNRMIPLTTSFLLFEGYGYIYIYGKDIRSSGLTMIAVSLSSFWTLLAWPSSAPLLPETGSLLSV
jgi:hypothetical protein